MIEAKNLCYTYSAQSKSRQTAVENINISVKRGETLGIIGKTGSGKSTLAQLLCGLLKPDSGEVKLNEKNINKDFKNSRELFFKIGMVFQYPEQQLFASTVFDDIAFGPRNKGTCEADVTPVVTQACEFAKLDLNLLERSPFELSGGEKRRCAIAGVIAMKPSILILDEPTAALDPGGKEKLLESLINYHKKENNTIIFISHTMEEIARVSDNVLVMDEGKQILYGTPENVFNQTRVLQNIGLDVPQTAKIISLINEKGYNLPKNILTPQKAQIEIYKILKSRGLKND